MYIIPGFTHTGNEPGYKKTAALFRKKGYTPIIFHPAWKRKTVTDVAVDFLNFYEQKKHAHTKFSLLGFSFGAIIALITAGKIHPEKLFLCSLSPYFSEDLPNIPGWWKKFIGKRRVDDFSALSCKRLCALISSKTHIFVGEIEITRYPQLLIRAAHPHTLIKLSELTVIPKAKHDIGQKEYLQAISEKL